MSASADNNTIYYYFAWPYFQTSKRIRNVFSVMFDYLASHLIFIPHLKLIQILLLLLYIHI